jgi:hypothetical protein
LKNQIAAPVVNENGNLKSEEQRRKIMNVVNQLTE